MAVSTGVAAAPGDHGRRAWIMEAIGIAAAQFTRAVVRLRAWLVVGRKSRSGQACRARPLLRDRRKNEAGKSPGERRGKRISQRRRGDEYTSRRSRNQNPEYLSQ